MTEARTTLQSASIISLSATVGALAGFILQLLVAYYFGASTSTDAFFMAQSTSELLSKLLLGGSIAAVFLPLFVERIAAGNREAAWQLGLNLLHLTTGVFIIALVLLWFLADPFIHFIAPGFDDETRNLTVQLLRVLLPSFLLLFLVDLVTAMLHALKHFLTPALLRIVAPLVSAVVVTLSVQQLGIFSLAWGVVLGSVIQLLLVVIALYKHGFRYRFVLHPTDPTIRKLLYLVYPFITSVIVTQAAGIVYRILVSDLATGSLSSLKYAEKITQLLTIIFLSSITTVIFPLLSAKASRQDYPGMRQTIAGAIRIITFITLPAIVGVVLLRQPLIALIYQRGSFSPEDAAMTSVALLYFILGLTINGISSVLGHAVLALQQTRASVAVTVASQAIAISLFILLVPRMGHAGLALGSALVPIAITVLYLLYLTRFITNISNIFWHKTYLKIIVLTAGMGVAVYGLSQWLTKQVPTNTALVLFLPIVLGVGVFFVGAYLWRIPEAYDVLALLQKRTIKKVLL